MPVPTVMPQPGERAPSIDAHSTNAGRFSLAAEDVVAAIRSLPEASAT